ncbi:MAG: response regulator, partial [Promethearchaeota archaeon]
FLVYLPVQEEPPLLKKHLKTSKKELKKDNKKAETKQSILILEDDKAIQRILKKLLQHLHYETVFTENGEDTIQLYKEAFNNNHKFDLVILDLTIPGGLGGKEVIQDLRFFDPDIRAIVASGYSNDPIMANPSKYGFIDVLKKPFSLNQLREIITKII